jgi:VWFA-related protein
MKSFAILLLAATVAAPALAVPVDTPQSSFGESIDVRVVNVEAVVTDRRGNRVPGLTPADFRMLVDGREVPVDYFTEIKDGEVAASASSPKEGAPAAAAPAGPGEKVGINYLVYIDNQFSIPSRRNIVLRRLAADLGRLGPQDRMTLVTFDGFKLQRLSDWTGDRQAMARAFAQAEESPSFGILRLAQRESDNYNPGQCLLNPKSVAAAMDMGTGMRLGIRAIVAAMRGTLAPPGRKVLVFLNGGWGFPDSATNERGLPSAIDLPEAEKVFAPVYDTANLLGYTLYPVEVHGMMFSGSLWNEARIPFPMENDFILSGFERSVQYDLEVMARETGGKALLNSARLDTFARVAADTSSYYWLGFTPEWQADDRRHDIRVEVRRPGLAVRSRSGFSDLSQETQAQAQAESLLLFGGSGADESLVVTAGALRQVSRRLRELPVTVEIPADALVPQPAEGGWVLSGSLSVGLLEKSSASPHWRTLPVRLTMSKLPPAGGRVQWQTVLKLPKSAGKLIFAFGGENGKVSAWTQLDFQHLVQERTASLVKGEK